MENMVTGNMNAENSRTRNKRSSLDYNTSTTDQFKSSQFNTSAFLLQSLRGSKVINNKNKKLVIKVQNSVKGDKGEKVKPKTIDVSDFDYDKFSGFLEASNKKKQIQNRMMNNGINNNPQSNSPNTSLPKKKVHYKSVSIMTNSIINQLVDADNTPVNGNLNLPSPSTEKFRKSITNQETSPTNTKFYFSSAYFNNILKEYKEKTNKVSIKGLDPNKKTIEKLLNPESWNISLTKKRESPQFFLTNELSNMNCCSPSPRKKNRKHTIKRTQMNLLFKNYDKKDTIDNKESCNVITNTENKTQFQRHNMNSIHTMSKASMVMAERNKNIVDHNNSIKILCYNSPSNQDLTGKDLLTEHLAKDYSKMTVNKSKCKMMEGDTSYKRLKSLDSKLPLLVNSKVYPIRVTLK